MNKKLPERLIAFEKQDFYGKQLAVVSYESLEGGGSTLVIFMVGGRGIFRGTFFKLHVFSYKKLVYKKLVLRWPKF